MIPWGVVQGLRMKLHSVEVLKGDLLLASLSVPTALRGLGRSLLDLIDHLLLISLQGVSPKLEVFLIALEG